MTDGPPRRVRVTADDGRPTAPRGQVTRPQGVRAHTVSVRGIAMPDSPADEAEAVYSRALRRTQLRLALGTVIGFVVVAVALSVALAGISELDRIALWGVPLSWLIHAFAFYPVIVVFAVLYTRTAARNEERYRALRERE